jgi:hypothetical protein
MTTVLTTDHFGYKGSVASNETQQCSLSRPQWLTVHFIIYSKTNTRPIIRASLSFSLSISLLLLPLWSIGYPWKSLFHFTFLILGVGRTHWKGDKPVVKPTTYTNRIKTDIIHALGGIQSHDPSVRTGVNSSCLRSRGHRNRPYAPILPLN